MPADRFFRPATTSAPAAPRILRRLGAAALLALAVPHDAGAQAFLGRGAPQALAVPGAETRPDVRDAAVRPAAPAPAPEVSAPPPLTLVPQRPLPATRSGLRLSGEESSLQWPVYLTEAEAQENLRFRIGYLAAISVVPETSSLTLTINDTVVGRSAIRAPGAVKLVEFDLPPGLLKPGYNAVSITGVHRHRVDCSLPATYELWTQIDPSWTGFVLPPGSGSAQGLRDLAAVAPDARGTVPIRVVLRDKPTFEVFEQVVGLLQRVALAGGYTHVSVEFGPPRQGPAGLNLVIGNPEDLREVARIGPGDVASGQPLTFLPAATDRAATLVVPGSNAADIAAALEAVSASAAHAAAGSAPGLRMLALSRGTELRGGETLRLADLGVANREFTGRLFRTGFDVVLPADVITADYGKAVLTLEGGYTAGLDPRAHVVIDVNGRNAASTPLPRAEGEMFRDAQVALPLGRWRPGRNRIDISAYLPAAQDRVCREDEVEPKRFLFLNETKLSLPRLARALRLPDLAATASSSAPFVGFARRPRLVVPTPDRDSMGAAVTMAVHLALAAGRPVNFELANERPLEGRTPTLVVGPVRSLDPEVLRAAGLDPQQIQQIWQGRAVPVGAEPAKAPAPAEGLSLDRLRTNLSPACALPAATSRSLPVVQRTRPGPARVQAADLASSWGASLRGTNTIGDSLSTVGAKLGAAAQDAYAAASRWTETQVREAEIEVDARASLIVGQGIGGRDVGSLLTVVTAPTAAALQASVTCLTSPAVWDRLQGRVAVLDANDGSVTTYEAARTHIVETTPRTFENLRLIVAGWFSSNPSTFALMLFAAAVSLGLTTSAMLRGVGRTSTERRDEGGHTTGERR
ncbi:cellulose biosynthesis cyclic di-GMP-binding regulatory protein BcsB [Methylobacterium oryzisoli]|uniref:cellulose biosynthesis cyclic di-GMP-binding regulatory protein BcsB n=1 Tax=Methylobacterium oryzisoli TaxID=3385502 RepID=UPI0038919B31